MSSALLEKELNTPTFPGEDDVRQYLSEIRSFPRLSKEEEHQSSRVTTEDDLMALREKMKQRKGIKA